jgi:hypothetical protein
MTPLAMVGAVLASIVGGSIVMVTVVFLGIKLNLKGMGNVYAGIRQDPYFYRMWALTGGALGAAFSIAIPLLDAALIKDPRYGLILISISLAIFLPMMLFLRRERRRNLGLGSGPDVKSE